MCPGPHAAARMLCRKRFVAPDGRCSPAAAPPCCFPAGCPGLGGGRSEIQDPMRPLHVVVVTLDTLSARHLGQYGNRAHRKPLPSAGAAAEGVLFEQATAQVPLTLPSHSSMFTGTYPMFHGVRDNGGYYLDDDSETLAETLRAAGWRTGGFPAAFVLDSRWGLDQGFERYHDEFDFRDFERISLDSVQRRGDEVLEAALAWMDEVKEETLLRLDPPLRPPTGPTKHPSLGLLWSAAIRTRPTTAKSSSPTRW